MPVFTTPAWYAGRERAPHLEQPGHRERLLLAADMVHEAHTAYGIQSVVDLGAGDGGLLSWLEAPDGQPWQFGPTMWGYDLQQTNVAGARERGVDVHLGDVLHDDIEWGDLAVATEILEHLLDPHGFVRYMAQKSQAVVVSSPYTETDVEHYEFHTFAWDISGYQDLVTQGGFSVVRHETAAGSQVILGVQL
jgi:hypothetical protein